MNDLLFFFFSLALSKKYVCFNMKRYRKIQNILILRFICFVSVFTSFILVVCVCIYILESNVLILYEKATPMCPMCLSRVATCWGWVTRRSLEDTLLVMWTEAHLTMMLFKRTKGLALKEDGSVQLLLFLSLRWHKKRRLTWRAGKITFSLWGSNSTTRGVKEYWMLIVPQWSPKATADGLLSQNNTLNDASCSSSSHHTDASFSLWAAWLNGDHVCHIL